MTVAILHYSAPPIVGGVESVMGYHAHLMANNGHSVRMLAGRGAPLDARITYVEIPLLDSRNADVLSVKAELDRGFIPGQFYALKDRIAEALAEALEGVQILIAHNVCSLNKNLPLTAALKSISEQAGSPRIYLWHHDLAWTTPRYQHELYPRYPWDLLRTDWPGVEQVVVSDLRHQELAELLQIPPDRIAVIPNGVDIIQFLGLGEQSYGFVKQLGLLSAEPLLLLPVRITPRKNIELALRTLAALVDRFPNPVLVVTGPPGPHNPLNVNYLEQLGALRGDLGLVGRAHFLAELHTGFLPDAVIAELYRLGDALLLPSSEEGFGIPVLEAGLAGMPIFCSDIPPLVSLGGDDANYFSPHIEPKTLAAMIHARLTQDQTYRMRVQVRKNFIWEQIYTKFIAPIIAGASGR